MPSRGHRVHERHTTSCRAASAAAALPASSASLSSLTSSALSRAAHHTSSSSAMSLSSLIDASAANTATAHRSRGEGHGTNSHSHSSSSNHRSSRGHGHSHAVPSSSALSERRAQHARESSHRLTSSTHLSDLTNPHIADSVRSTSHASDATSNAAITAARGGSFDSNPSNSSHRSVAHDCFSVTLQTVRQRILDDLAKELGTTLPLSHEAWLGYDGRVAKMGMDGHQGVAQQLLQSSAASAAGGSCADFLSRCSKVRQHHERALRIAFGDLAENAERVSSGRTPIRMSHQQEQRGGTTPRHEENIHATSTGSSSSSGNSSSNPNDSLGEVGANHHQSGHKDSLLAASALVASDKKSKENNNSSGLINGHTLDEEEDITVSSVEFSLLCPYSRLPMRVPVRSRVCRHVQCCDLDSWMVLLNKGRSLRDPTGPCPVCETRIAASSLEVDYWMLQVHWMMPPGTKLVVLTAADQGRVYSADVTREQRKQRIMTEIIDATQNSASLPSEGAHDNPYDGGARCDDYHEIVDEEENEMEGGEVLGVRRERTETASHASICVDTMRRRCEQENDERTGVGSEMALGDMQTALHGGTAECSMTASSSSALVALYHRCREQELSSHASPCYAATSSNMVSPGEGTLGSNVVANFAGGGVAAVKSESDVMKRQLDLPQVCADSPNSSCVIDVSTVAAVSATSATDAAAVLPLTSTTTHTSAEESSGLVIVHFVTEEEEEERSRAACSTLRSHDYYVCHSSDNYHGIHCNGRRDNPTCHSESVLYGVQDHSLPNGGCSPSPSSSASPSRKYGHRCCRVLPTQVRHWQLVCLQCKLLFTTAKETSQRESGLSSVCCINATTLTRMADEGATGLGGSGATRTNRAAITGQCGECGAEGAVTLVRLWCCELDTQQPSQQQQQSNDFCECVSMELTAEGVTILCGVDAAADYLLRAGFHRSAFGCDSSRSELARMSSAQHEKSTSNIDGAHVDRSTSDQTARNSISLVLECVPVSNNLLSVSACSAAAALPASSNACVVPPSPAPWCSMHPATPYCNTSTMQARTESSTLRTRAGVWVSTLAFTRTELDFLEACCQQAALGARTVNFDGIAVPLLFRTLARRYGSGGGYNSTATATAAMVSTPTAQTQRVAYDPAQARFTKTMSTATKHSAPGSVIGAKDGVHRADCGAQTAGSELGGFVYARDFVSPLSSLGTLPSPS